MHFVVEIFWPRVFPPKTVSPTDVWSTRCFVDVALNNGQLAKKVFLGATTFSVTTFGIMTLSIKRQFDTRHKNNPY